MKIERKIRSTRRDKKQRKNHLEKRTQKKSNNKYHSKISAKEEIEKHSDNNYVIENEIGDDIKYNFFNKLSSLVTKKMLIAASLSIAVIIISLNITPILKYAVQDKDSAIYPILKKYADDLRSISSRLTVVTRRLNMLSLISEENELPNTTRINKLVLQINDMWFTTKKYLNFIGIETIARTELEKEIDANSKINEKGLIRETKTEEIIPKDEITLMNVMKLDSIIQDLNIGIDSINSEISFLEDSAFAAIKTSHIYSQLLERSRNANGNYYANSSLKTNDNNFKVNNRQPVVTTKKISISNDVAVKTKKSSITKTIDKNKQHIASKPIKTQPVKTVKTVKTVKQSQKSVAKKIRTPIKKIVGAFTIKEKPAKKNKIKIKEVVKVDEPFVSPSLLNDLEMNYVTNYNDYDDPENEKVNDVTSPQDDVDYSYLLINGSDDIDA